MKNPLKNLISHQIPWKIPQNIILHQYPEKSPKNIICTNPFQRMLLHILSLNPAAPAAYQDEALKRARISRQDRPAHSSSDYLSFSIQKNKKKLQIVDKVAYNYNYINDKLLDSLWGEVQFTKRMQVDHRLNTRPGLPGSELEKFNPIQRNKQIWCRWGWLR